MQISSCTLKGFQIGPFFLRLFEKDTISDKAVCMAKRIFRLPFTCSCTGCTLKLLCAQMNFPLFLWLLCKTGSQRSRENRHRHSENMQTSAERVKLTNLIAEATALTIGERSDSQNLTRKCRSYQMQNAVKTNTALVFV